MLTHFWAHSTCLDLWPVERRFLLFFTAGTFLLTHHFALAAALHGLALILTASFLSPGTLLLFLSFESTCLSVSSQDSSNRGLTVSAFSVPVLATGDFSFLQTRSCI